MFFKLLCDGEMFMIEQSDDSSIVKNRIDALGTTSKRKYNYEEISELEFNEISKQIYKNNRNFIK